MFHSHGPMDLPQRKLSPNLALMENYLNSLVLAGMGQQPPESVEILVVVSMLYDFLVQAFSLC